MIDRTAQTERPAGTIAPRAATGLKTGLVVALTLAAVGLLSLWPLAWVGYPQYADDARYHSTWAMHFLQEMLAGNFYPRWLPAMNGGLGSPVFFFYGPVSFWLTSLAATLVTPSTPFAPLAIVAAVMLLASGITAYAWLRAVAPPLPALVGAALYTVMPYHLTIDLWTRSAFAEFNGFVWTPLLFLGIERIRQGRRTGVLLVSFAFALLTMTHIISAMLASVMAGAYALARLRRPSAFLMAAAAVAFGIALSAVYLSTALGLKDQASVGVGEIARMWFLPVGQGHPRTEMMLMITVIVVVESVFALALLLTAVFRQHLPARALVITWSGLTVAALLATTILAEPVWNRMPILQSAQFPFRILAFADIGITTLAALVLGPLLARWRRPGIAAAALLAAIALAGIVQDIVPLRLGFFRPGSPSWMEHFAAQSDQGVFRPIRSLNRLPVDREPPEHIPAAIVQVTEGSATAHLTARDGNRYVFDVQSTGPAVLRIGQLYFTGWTATVAGTVLPLRASEQGLLEVIIPPGAYTLELRLVPTGLERAGLAVSEIAAALWLLTLVWITAHPIRRAAPTPV